MELKKIIIININKIWVEGFPSTTQSTHHIEVEYSADSKGYWDSGRATKLVDVETKQKRKKKVNFE